MLEDEDLYSFHVILGSAVWNTWMLESKKTRLPVLTPRPYVCSPLTIAKAIIIILAPDSIIVAHGTPIMSNIVLIGSSCLMVQGERELVCARYPKTRST